MANGTTRGRNLKRGEKCPMQKLGYEDYRLGRGISPLVARLGEIDQKNYHNGRLICAYIQGAGIVPPRWSPTAKGFPDGIRDLARRTSMGADQHRCVLIGRIQPDDPDLAFTRPHLDRRGFPLPVLEYAR